ncbi:MAG: methyltransferase domain-containing protein [Acidimicrobiaceae bacterium]|nr:methyltransferase domain-containing protein [Acidimicrobiaceae bacterium]
MLSQIDFRGNELVLDAGCGVGNLTINIASQIPNGHIIAVDKSKSMITEASSKTSHLRTQISLLRADLLYIPIQECVDTIFSNATFHWIHDHFQLFSEMYRILRPGGTISAQFGGGPNIKSLINRFCQLSKEPEFEYLAEQSFPWNFRSIEETKSCLIRAGFIEIQISLVEAPVVFPDVSSYSHFVEKIILFPVLGNVPDDETQRAFLTRLGTESLNGEKPLTVDYWRINILARKPK